MKRDGRALFMSQSPQSALPERSDADEEHDYAEKDRTDGVWAPLILVETTELKGCRLRQVRGAQIWGYRGRGVQGWVRGHRALFRSVRGIFVSGGRENLDVN